MKSKQEIAMLGGDLRQYAAALRLGRNGWTVRLWGLDRSDDPAEGIALSRSCEEAVSGASAVVLPLPASTDGIFLHCPLDASERQLRLSELLEMMSAGGTIVGGRIPEPFCRAAEGRGICVRDYFESEEFQIENAYTTAEAAISIAMNSLNKNLCGANVAITGYGRIAKHLVRLLSALGARVTVCARKERDLSWARSLGCSTVKLDSQSVMRLTCGYDVIYNTVPHWLFERSFLEKVEKQTFLIDLASVPGGVDICAAKELGSNVLWATSLPGKYAPMSAGELIADCVDRILRQEERKG